MTYLDENTPENEGAENEAPKTRVINEGEIENDHEPQDTSDIESQSANNDQPEPVSGKEEPGVEVQPTGDSLQSKVGESIPPPPNDDADYGYKFPSSEERTWASIAHLSILLNLFTIFLGPLVALIIYLVYKDKSRYVAYQSMQALIFQLVFWLGAGIIASFLWIVSLLLMIVIIGCCLLPVAIFFSVIPIIALVYGVIGGIETSQGSDFKYWSVGEWVRGILEQ